MSSAQDEDSVVEAPAVSTSLAIDPSDPFLNPRRSSTATQAAQALPNHSNATAPIIALSSAPPADTAQRHAITTNSGAPTVRNDVSLVKDPKASETAKKQPSTCTAPQPATKRRRTDAPATNAKLNEAAKAEQQAPKGSSITGSGNSQVRAPHAANTSRSRGDRGAPPSTSDASEMSDEDERRNPNQPNMEHANDAALLDGAASDDEGEGDAEEKALLAAASAVTTPGTAGSSGASTPHPWLVTDAFHVSLWYVLRYAGSALSAADLWACRALLSLTAVLPPPLDQVSSEDQSTASAPAGGGGAKGEDGATVWYAGAWTWSGSEESELLLRLVLRKPHGFTGRHLETRYGDWLHVQPTLAALTERRFLWWPSRAFPRESVDGKNTKQAAGPAKTQSTARSDPPQSKSGDCSTPSSDVDGLSSVAMLEPYDGARVARMVLQESSGGDGGERAVRRLDKSSVLSPAQEELVRVLQAVRGIELRVFLTALRQGSKACMNKGSGGQGGSASPSPPPFNSSNNNNNNNNSGTPQTARQGVVSGTHGGVSRPSASTPLPSSSYKDMPLGDNSLYDAIPGRKRDMIRYFVERRYSVWAPTAPPATDTMTNSQGGAGAGRPFSGSTEVNRTARPGGALTSTSRARFPAGQGTVAQQPPQQPQQQSNKRVSGSATGIPSSGRSRTLFHSSTQPTTVSRCFRDAAEEANVVATCWDTHVGPVYAPHAGLKAHLVWMTELFHVLTSNGGAGAVGQQGLKPLAATMAVAAPPTLLMVRPQLLLLLQSLRSARQLRQEVASLHANALPNENDEAEEDQNAKTSEPLQSTSAALNAKNSDGERAAGTSRTTNAAFLNSVPHALLPRWFTAPTFTLSASTASSSSPLKSSVQAEATADTTSAQKCVADQTPPLAGGGVSVADDDEIICSARSFHSLDVDDEGQPRDTAAPGLPPPVQLFGTTAMLHEYRAALYAHRALYEVTDGAASAAQRFRARNEGFVAHMHDTVLSAVRVGVEAVKRHPLKPTGTPAQLAEAARFVPPPSSLLATSSASPPLSLDAMLYSSGQHAEHLLLFTPLFRWFACLELLYQVLQSARRYAEANECLRYLLHEPVYVLHHLPDHRGGAAAWTARELAQAARGLSPVTYAFRYKTHKRGEWLSRLAQNLSHLKRYPEALAILEEAQAGYHELAGEVAERINGAAPFASTTNAAAAVLCAFLTNTAPDETKLPLKVQRRGRMLRVLWPANSSVSTSAEKNDVRRGGQATAPPLPLFHAVWEYVRERYCRRHDRLVLEKSLAMLHRRVRHWTPLAPHRQLATRQLADVAVRRVGGVRDAMDYMLWREPSGLQSGGGRGPKRGLMSARSASGTANDGGGTGEDNCSGNTTGTRRRPALPVELFVLEHFVRKWNGAMSDSTAAAAAAARQADANVGMKRPRNQHDAITPIAKQPSTHGATDTRRGLWRGAHCEGQWIRCLAHALLWECYWAYPSVATHASDAADRFKNEQATGDASTVDAEVLWLSAFQDGPLDVTTPVNFVLRRRALIEARLTQLEQCTREELLAWVAAHIKTDSAEPEQRASGDLKGVARRQARSGSESSSSSTGSPESNVQIHAVGGGNDDGDSDDDAKRNMELDAMRKQNETVAAASFTARRADSTENSVSTADHVSHRDFKAEEDELSLPNSTLRSPAQDASTPLPLLSEAGGASRDAEKVNSEGVVERLEEVEALAPFIKNTSTFAGDADTGSAIASAEASPTIPEAWKVPVGSLPLLDILRVLPLQPLWRLLRCLYLSPVTEGVSLRFSGFPDLIFWRSSDSSDGDGTVDAAADNTIKASSTGTCSTGRAGESTAPFCLMEVKSPSDTLSTKQIAVNDMLHRCGFDVCVLRVDAVHDNGVPVSTKKLR